MYNHLSGTVLSIANKLDFNKLACIVDIKRKVSINHINFSHVIVGNLFAPR